MRRFAVLVVLALLSVVPLPHADAAGVKVVAVDTLAPRRPPAHSQPDPVGPPREVAPLRTGPGDVTTDNNAAPRGPVQTTVMGASAPSVGVDVFGFKFNGAVPPDPAGEVGATQFVHTANTFGGAKVGVFDKTTGALVKSFAMDSLASSGACQHGLGDGVPIWDQLDSRWILTEIASRSASLCVYVSDGPDAATASYTAYRIEFNVFPDYPKWSVWPNALYLGFNLSGFSDPIVAFNKTKMIAGATLTSNDAVVENVPAEPGFGFQLLSPVDLDGATPPPPTTPGIFVRHVDDEVNGSGPADPAHDFIEYVELLPDFATGTDTLGGPFDVAVAEFDSRLCPHSGSHCVPQKHTRRHLDSLRQPVMNRPVMRVVGANQVMVGTFTVDAGHNRAAVEWFELSRPVATTTGGWTVADQGTYAPTGLHRWVPSIDINDAGDIALGYSTSSKRTLPAIAVTGRHAGDPSGEMTQDETQLIGSKGPQRFASRWGDYTEMSVDPVDNATFWYTNEYINRRGKWRTRIASFTF